MYIKNRILPVPQELKLTKGKCVVLGKPGSALYRLEIGELPNTPVVKSALELLTDHLTGILNADAYDANGDIPIRISVGTAPSGIKNPDQGYRLEVSSEGVELIGFGDLGLFYGALTLKQCLVLEDNKLALPFMKITDWPDLKTRGHFMESRYGSNLMTLDDWKYVVDHMAGMKMNQLVISVYGCWCVQYDGRVSEYMYVPIKKYPKLKTPVVIKYYSPSQGRWINEECLPPMFEQDFLGELIAYGKTKGVTVFPLFNSYGHNTLIPAQYPEVSAKDENGEPTLTGFCTANPKTYEMLFDIYDEIIDRYLKPNRIDCFHVGLDEVWDGIALNAEDIYRIRSPWCKCEKCKDIDRKKLFINHAIRLLTHLKERGMKNIYMYHDMLIGHGRSTDGDATEDMMRALKENDLTDVVVIDWWTYSDFQENLMFQTTRPELGLRRTVKPWNGYYHWTLVTHPLRNIKLLADMGHKEGVEGMQSYSAWDESYDRNHVCQADYSWNYEGTGSLEQMKLHYVDHYFGTQQEKAKTAFALLDLITEDRKGSFENGGPIVSNYRLMLSTLSYYFYSYVRAGKPYPRSFPGEAVASLLSDRSKYEKALLEIRAMAKQAKELFEEIALDPRCNVRMALRYAYEANYYLCLVEDYLALLQMVDYNESSCPYKYEKIKNLAGERKLARLSLMGQMERTKEKFLFASHLRNQSIFMQFFADLEGYLAETDPSKVSLDFTDLSPIASQAFKELR
jgi:hypothetical protein